MKRYQMNCIKVNVRWCDYDKIPKVEYTFLQPNGSSSTTNMFSFRSKRIGQSIDKDVKRSEIKHAKDRARAVMLYVNGELSRADAVEALKSSGPLPAYPQRHLNTVLEYLVGIRVKK